MKIYINVIFILKFDEIDFLRINPKFAFKSRVIEKRNEEEKLKYLNETVIKEIFPCILGNNFFSFENYHEDDSGLSHENFHNVHFQKALLLIWSRVHNFYKNVGYLNYQETISDEININRRNMKKNFTKNPYRLLLNDMLYKQAMKSTITFMKKNLNNKKTASRTLLVMHHRALAIDYDDDQHRLKEEFIKTAFENSQFNKGDHDNVEIDPLTLENDEEILKPMDIVSSKRVPNFFLHYDSTLHKVEQLLSEKPTSDIDFENNYIKSHDSDSNISAHETKVNTFEKQELFEHWYKFSSFYQEVEHLKNYPRKIKGTVRKLESRRKNQRMACSHRFQNREKALTLEVKRINTLKNIDNLSKVSQLLRSAGPGALKNHLQNLIQNDFDSINHDKKFSAIFGEEYYKYMDEFDTKFFQPKNIDTEQFYAKNINYCCKKEKSITHGPLDNNVNLKHTVNNHAISRSEINERDFITNFRYTEVPKENSNLSAWEILTLTDKELNHLITPEKFVSRKRKK